MTRDQYVLQIARGKIEKNTDYQALSCIDNVHILRVVKTDTVQSKKKTLKDNKTNEQGIRRQ